ncbi:unnamed protein product, partial [marine sediment metagenome]
DHFAAATRAAPQNPQAREGLLEALKSHSLLYRLLQHMGFRVGDSKRGRGRITRGSLMYTAPVATAAVGKAVGDAPEAGSVLWPLVGLLWVLAVLVQITHLRAVVLASRSEYRELALTPYHTLAVACGGCTLLAAVLLGCAYFMIDHFAMLAASLLTCVLVEPIQTAARTPPSRTRTAMGICVGVMVASNVLVAAILWEGTEGKRFDEQLPASLLWPLLGYFLAGGVLGALAAWREEAEVAWPKAFQDPSAPEVEPRTPLVPPQEHASRP